jgi:hypothetical protein
MRQNPHGSTHGHSRRTRLRSLGTGVVVLAAGLTFALVGDGSQAGPADARVAVAVAESALAAPVVGADVNPAHVLGVAGGDCKQCHAAEVAHWTTTKHFNSEKTLFAANAKKYATALKIPEASIRKDSMCVNCHATPSSHAGALQVVSGVSCESCHGAAGGQEGWLNQHHVYGPNVTPRENETPEHRAMRIAKIEAAGMIRSANLFEIARNCYQCHLVASGELVTAGHKAESSAFEVTSWLNGEVRHNYFLDQSTNAPVPTLWAAETGRTAEERKRLLFVCGILADLEASLRIRATAGTNPAYSGQISGRIAAINGAKLSPMAAVPEIAPLLGKVGGSLGRLFIPMPDDEKVYNDLADEIAKAAHTFLENHDGSKLQFLDPMIPATKPKS